MLAKQNQPGEIICFKLIQDVYMEVSVVYFSFKDMQVYFHRSGIHLCCCLVSSQLHTIANQRFQKQKTVLTSASLPEQAIWFLH